MITQDLDTHVRTLRHALLEKQTETADRERAWLMGKVASALLYQDAEALKALRARVADLAPLADEHGNGRPGDRWRAVWEILHACSETIRPLEQVRLARPEQLSGKFLRLISERQGITPTELRRATGKESNHVSNTLRSLTDQGLVHAVAQGRERHYYLSSMGRGVLPEPAPPPTEKIRVVLVHLDSNRLPDGDVTRPPGFTVRQGVLYA